MRILNITNQVPYPLVSGAPLRTYNILRRFARSHEVYLAAFNASEEQSEGVAHLRKFCRDVVTVRLKSLKESVRWGKVLTSMLRGEPPEINASFSEELAGEIRRLTDRLDFDVVQIEHGSMGIYLEALPVPLRKRTAWVLHDIDFDKFLRIARIEHRNSAKMRAWVHATTMRRWQPRFASLFGLCVTMSDADRQLLKSRNGSLQVDVSPNGVDTKHYRSLADEGNDASILFIGNMGYEPNADAAAYFCHDILPLIQREIADSKLYIVGINPRPSVVELQDKGVQVTGSVPDVVPYYTQAKVCVVPLRAGSGTRLKILEAMALGRPVVSTPLGCEGLDVIDGEHILIADDSKQFAEQVVKLLRNRELRSKIAANAREFVVAHYDWDVISERLMGSLEALAKQPQSINSTDTVFR